MGVEQDTTMRDRRQSKPNSNTQNNMPGNPITAKEIEVLREYLALTKNAYEKTT